MGLERWYKNAKSDNTYFEIAKRNVPTHFSINKFGENPSVAGTLETIWDKSTIYAYPAIAANFTLSSGSATDTILGTGARKVKVFGLNENYVSISEEVELSGQTGVFTEKKYIRMFRVVVTEAGSGGTAVGIIYAGTGTVATGIPAIIHAQIVIGNNQTLMCVYTVPAGYTGYITTIAAAAGTGKDATLSLVTREFGTNVFNIKRKIILIANSVVRAFEIPFMIAEKTDIEIRAISVAAGAPVTASFDMILVKAHNSIPDIA